MTASVTFSVAVGGDGTTVTDDSNATTGLDNYGWRTRFVPCLTNLVNVAQYTVNQAAAAAASATQAASTVSNANNCSSTDTTTNRTIASGLVGTTISWTVQSGKAYQVGMPIYSAITASPTNAIYGVVSSYSGTSLSMTVTQVRGAGTASSWTISLSGGAIFAGGLSGTQSVTASTVLTTGGTTVICAMTAPGQSLTMPNATLLTQGAQIYCIDNTKGMYAVGIRDSSGALLMAVAPGGIAEVFLRDNSTSAGLWGIEGLGLEPGLVTIDVSFGSTYLSTTDLTAWTTFDSNTSVHFLVIAAGGFAAYVVDNTGKVVSTPVTVSSTSGSVPRAAFNIDATHVIVFYGSSTTDHNAAVLTLTGSSPTFSLSVGTAGQITNAMPSGAWAGEEAASNVSMFAQLSPTLYLFSWVAGSNLQAVAISVSGTTVTMGSPLTSIVASVSPLPIVTKLTSTTGLIVYKASGAPFLISAIAVSISGTTITPGTAVSSGMNSSAGSNQCSFALLSPTLAIVGDDNNGGSGSFVAFAISGTTLTASASVLNGLSNLTANSLFFTQNSWRDIGHIIPISTTSFWAWGINISGLSQAGIFTVAGSPPVITAPTNTTGYNFSNGTSSSAGFGKVIAVTSTEALSVRNIAAPANGSSMNFECSKVGASVLTNGKSRPAKTIVQTPGANSQFAVRLSSTDICVASSYSISSPNCVIPVLRTNGDDIMYRGDISIPPMGNPTYNPLCSVASNRVVFMGQTFGALGGTGGGRRVLSIEIAK